jgi:hypothetical protein
MLCDHLRSASCCQLGLLQIFHVTSKVLIHGVRYDYKSFVCRALEMLRFQEILEICDQAITVRGGGTPLLYWGVTIGVFGVRL